MNDPTPQPQPGQHWATRDGSCCEVTAGAGCLVLDCYWGPKRFTQWIVGADGRPLSGGESNAYHFAIVRRIYLPGVPL